MRRRRPSVAQIYATHPAWLALLVLAVAGSVAHQAFLGTLAEDAFISLRYSRQLLDGNGLVFNPGEQVEGYSNFLWVMVTAAGGIFTDDLVLVARVLGAVSAAATVALTAVLTTTLTRSAPSGVAAAILVAASGTMSAWGPSGLETPLFAALILGGLLLVVQGRPGLAGLVIAAATMTRPDGIIIAICLLIGYLVRRERRSAARFALATAVPCLVWMLWRISYYGHAIPNAVAAKSGMDLGWQLESGWTYVSNGIGANWPLVVAATAGTLAALLRPPTESVKAFVVLVASTVIAYLAFVVLAGGDWMPAFRFLVPVVPLLAVLAGIGTAVVRGTPGRVVTSLAVLFAAAALVVTSAVHPDYHDRIDDWHRAVDELSSVGDWMQRTLPAGTPVATYANGGFSYHARDLVVIDVLGLTDEHIAREGARLARGMIGHAASDWDYVVNERRPWIIYSAGAGWGRTADRSRLGGPADSYEPVVFQVEDDRWVLLHVRPDKVAEMTEMLSQDHEYRFVPDGQ